MTLARDVMPTITASVNLISKVLEASKFLFSNPDMKGQKPLDFSQRMRMMLPEPKTWADRAIYNTVLGEAPTEAQRKAYIEGQAVRSINALRGEMGDAPLIGKHLERLIELGEEQLRQRDNRAALE